VFRPFAVGHERFRAAGRFSRGLVRFAVTPPPKTVRPPRVEGFLAQIALAQIHPRLAPVQPVPGGYALDAEITRGWFELPAQRGFAGYGLTRALCMLLDVLNGLIALHDTKTESGARFVHGEVVPALLRVDRQGVARLIPLAPWHRLEAGTRPARERQGHLAPERLLGDALDQRADVFSCGVLLWEALAGGRLFETDAVETIVTRLMGGKLQLPELPPELAWAVALKPVAMCALAVDPTQRFADCAELLAAIEDVVGAHVASHEDVAAFFGAREQVSSPPSAQILPPSHISSLSALVSPMFPREAREAREVRSERQESAAEEEPTLLLVRPIESELPPSSRGRKLWAGIALLCIVLGAAGAGALTLRNAAHTVAQAPLAAAPLPAAASVPALASALAGTDAAPVASSAPVPVEGDRARVVRPEPALGAPAGKPHVKGVSTKPAAGTRILPAKVGPVRDKAADQYGI
jgi:hypothetical protein